jgi:hypothetical protein
MLTNNQKNQFADALVDLGWFSDPADALDDIVETRDEILDFVAHSPELDERMIAENGVELWVWLNVQKGAGQPRRDIAIADFGEFRAAFVS